MDVFTQYNVDGVIHLAAESHVDRSITDPFTFAKTNVMGTLSLLQASKESWANNFDGKLFYHVSTDEVYGTLEFDDSLSNRKHGEIFLTKLVLINVLFNVQVNIMASDE